MWSGIKAWGKNAVFGKVITGTWSGSVISISIAPRYPGSVANSTVSSDVNVRSRWRTTVTGWRSFDAVRSPSKGRRKFLSLDRQDVDGGHGTKAQPLLSGPHEPHSWYRSRNDELLYGHHGRWRTRRHPQRGGSPHDALGGRIYEVRRASGRSGRQTSGRHESAQHRF